MSCGCNKYESMKHAIWAGFLATLVVLFFSTIKSCQSNDTAVTKAYIEGGYIQRSDPNACGRRWTLPSDSSYTQSTTTVRQ